MNTKFRRYGYSCLGLMLCFFSMVANADELLNPTAKENLCIETFETGIQTHDAKGVVDFSYNSQLIGLEPGLINTPMIKYSPWSSKVNCDTQFCQIANSPPLLMSSPVLPEFPFLSTNSEESLYISFGQVEQIGENNKTDYSKINLQSEATAIFMPADEYKVSKLIVGNNSTLILSPGDYWIDELLLGSSSKIMVSGSASVRMYVKSPLNVAYQVKVNVDKDGNVANPGKFFLYNFSSLTLNSKAIISGHVYSQGAAKLDWKASIKGSLNASNITLNSEAIVQFDKSSLYRLDFGSYICDKDNDGIYDGFDQDSDNDGYIDDVELLIGTDPLDATSTPPDIDGDFIPDSLDADKDGDGVNNDVDVFPSDKTEWVDLDGDGTGDNSDLDIDGDGFNNDIETQLGTNPKDKTSTPPDMDGDFIPDSLDADKDGDDVNNDVDVFPSDKTEWADLDKDGTGDNSDLDIDGDSFSNDIETQLGTNPKDKTSTPPDMDGDFIPDSLDADKDGDGVSNDVDVFPADKNEWADLDGDGTGDNSDLDIDGDGFNNDIETQLGTNPKDTTSTPPDMDGDFIPDLLDADKDGDGVDNELDIFPSDKNEWADLDADGTGDNSDLDIDGDGFNNDIETQLGTSPQDKTSTPPDMDGDFIPDSLDADKDGDGVNNDVDIFPSDKTEWTDLDADGTGDNSDLDIDGDGFNNDIETQLGTDPKDVTSTPPDMDGDFIPDSLDNDKDGDGVNNDVDSFPTDKTEWSDLDNDGTGDNSDLDIDGDGIDNETEIAQGSDPNDKDSFPITTPPKLTLDGPNTLVTTSAEIMMSGTVYVENGTVSVAAISDHFPATPLATDISNGRWTVTVPLLEGANNIQLLATNSGGLQSNINVKVTYQNSTNVAAIDITSPMANSTVSDNTIILRGILSSELLADAMQLTIRSLNTVEQDKSNTVEQDKFISVETTLQKTSSATQFSFTSHPISLLQGLNKIELLAQIDDQTITRDFYITYYPEQIEMAPPEISIISPETGSLLDARSFSLVADIYAQAGIHSITLDGIEVASITAKTFDHRLQELITIESGQSNISLTLAVTDTQQQVTTKTIDLQLDTLAPIIILDKPLLQDPLVNQLNEALYTVSGTVTELNLASFMIQDQSVTLQPVSEGQYRFEQVVSLPAGEALTLTLQATDRATNTDIQSYSLQLDAQVALSFVLPAENSRLISHGTPLTLQTVLRVGQVISDTQLLLQVLNSAGEEVFQQLLAITETLINSDLILPASKGKYQIVATVKDSANSELVVARRSVEVLEAQAIALQLVNASPAENSSDSAANGFISLQFNKPIELQKLQLKVNETAHGKTYMDL
ncbi:MAG: hypothetical protein GY787_11450, partial [Alteromonadales bacterium]|nr:hypothetical protein [Alteromonadales bacterium]